MNSKNYDFANYLKEVRKNKKITLVDLAKIAGTSNSYLSQLENAKRNPPKPDLLKNIAAGLARHDTNEAHTLYEELMKKAGYIPDDAGFHLVKDEESADFLKGVLKVDEIMIDKLQSENEELKSKITLDKLITPGDSDLKIELDQQELTESELHAIRLLILGIRSNRKK